MGNKQTGNINQSSTPSNSDLSCEALSKKLSKTGNMNQLNRSITTYTDPMTFERINSRIETLRKEAIHYYKKLFEIIDPTMSETNEVIGNQLNTLPSIRLNKYRFPPEKYKEAQSYLGLLKGNIDNLNKQYNIRDIMTDIMPYAEQYASKGCVKGKDPSNNGTKGGRKTRRILRTHCKRRTRCKR